MLYFLNSKRDTFSYFNDSEIWMCITREARNNFFTAPRKRNNL